MMNDTFKNNCKDDIFDINMRIKEICQKNHITVYNLSKMSGVPYSALNSMFRRNTSPCFNTLFKICSGLNISLSDFFSDADVFAIHITDDIRYIIELYKRLPADKQKFLIAYLQGLCDNELSNLYEND